MLSPKYSNELLITIFTIKINMQQEKQLNQSFTPNFYSPPKTVDCFFFFSYSPTQKKYSLVLLSSVPSNSHKEKLDTIRVYRNQTLLFLVPCHFCPPWDNFLPDFLPNESRNGKAVRSQEAHLRKDRSRFFISESPRHTEELTVMCWDVSSRHFSCGLFY